MTGDDAFWRFIETSLGRFIETSLGVTGGDKDRQPAALVALLALATSKEIRLLSRIRG